MKVSRSLLLLAGALGALAAAKWLTFRTGHESGPAPAGAAEPLHTWEGEGGAVPVAGSTAPAQAVTPSEPVAGAPSGPAA